MNLLAAAFLLPLLQSPAADAPLPESPSLVSVSLGAAGGLTLVDLQGWGLDIARVSPDGEIEIVCDDADRRLLEERRVPHRVLHEDLVSFYRSRLHVPSAPSRAAYGAWLSPPFGSGSMGGYWTYNEVVSVLDQITAAYPNLTTAKFSVGTSIQGRDIWAVKVSDNPDVDENEPETRFDCLHHAREPESMQASLWFMLELLEGYGTDPLATYLVNEREIWFIPVVNPDGYVYNQSTNPSGGGMWRKNRRNNGGSYGVDLNRNYDYQWGYDDNGSSPYPSDETYRGPSPASEPETQAMQAFFATRNFITASSAHTYSNLFLYPWGYRDTPCPHDAELQELSALATALNGYAYGRPGGLLYNANGGTFDYDYGTHQTLSWTVEIGSSSDGFWPATSRIVPLAIENELTFEVIARAAGAWMRTLSLATTEVGDGDGYFEAGETVEFRYSVRNSGMAATNATLTLTTPSGDVTVTNGSVSLGTVASFANSDNNASPLSLTIAALTPGGTSIPYTLAIEYEGYAETTTGTILVGEPLPFLTDDLEVELGWLAGLPGDTATLGLWEYGDPVATDYNGEALNPGNDATANPGVNCYATGNGSTSSGGDDVDNGHTTLVTPAIDLSGVGAAMISYQRWYANLGDPQDDDFVVSISDDDGATWVPLETVSSTENSWTEVSFPVGDYVDQTANVRLRFVAEDDPNNSLTEAGIDELKVLIYEAGPALNVYGRQTLGDQIALHFAGESAGSYLVYYSYHAANFTLPMVDGPILIDPAFATLLTSGTIPASGLARTLLTLPADPALAGQTVHLQGVRIGATIEATNADVITFE